MSIQNTTLKNFFLVSSFSVIGYLKYLDFIAFINKLTLGISVQKLNNNVASVFLSTINSYGISYRIKKINFLSEDLIIGNVLNVTELNKMIVKGSQIPISVNLFTPTTKEVLEKSKAVITFIFFGFSFSRQYDLINTTKNIENPITVDITDFSNGSSQNTNPTKPSCGCN